MGVFYGLNNYTELVGEYTWDPRRGPTVIRNFKGTPDTIAALSTGLYNTKTRFHLSRMPDGGYSMLTTFQGAEDTQPVDQPLTDYWSLDGADIEESLWNHPDAIALFADMLDDDGNPTNQYTSVRRDIQDVVSGNKLLSEIAWWATASVSMKQFVHTLLIGQDTYFRSSWVLDRKTVIAWNSIIRPTTNNINKVYTSTLSLRQVEGVPDLPFDLPDGIWLKKSPKFDPLGSDKWQISQQWWWGDNYSTFSYQVAT